MERGKHNNHARASKQHRWVAGSRPGSTGHVRIRVGKSHPLSDPNGWTYEHLVVWVSAGNQKPLAGEVLHHVNGDKTDNRIENLRLMTKEKHSQLHNSKLDDGQVLEIREMYACGKEDMPTLALRFDVPQSLVSKIIRGETRRGAGGPISTNNRGKKAAGRLLDGREWNEYPITQSLNDQITI